MLAHWPRRLTSGLLVGFLSVLGRAAVAPSEEAEVAVEVSETVVLDTTSFWRCHFTWMLPAVRAEQDIVAIDPIGSVKDPIKMGKIEGDLRLSTPFPPAEWAQLDFDDSSWSRIPGPFFYDHSGLGASGGGNSRYLGLLCLRGKFAVRDPRRIKDLSFSITYRGGVVVYINGKELARGHMRAGEVTPATFAEDYPLEAFLNPEGQLLRHREGDPEEFADRFRLRVRKLSEIRVPSSLLKKGTNVLAVEVHRALLPGVVLEQQARHTEWATAGIVQLRLNTEDSAGITPNLVRPRGTQVWNADLHAGVYDQDYGAPNEALKPITLIGARNGTCSGQVVVGSTNPLRGLRAEVDDLLWVEGKGRIRASAIEVRYALLGSEAERNAQYRYPMVQGVHRFDEFAEVPPTEVPVMRREPARRIPDYAPAVKPVFGAVQPIWITVKVPKDAPAGTYRGKLKVSMEGASSVEVPIELEVADWAVPDPGNFVTHVDFIQSPDTLALYYKVPLWSDEHFELIARTFEQLGRIGDKVLYIPMICRTHFGNSETMIRWVKQDDGSYMRDYRLLDRYLDLYQRHVGKPRVIVLYIWERYAGTGRSWRHGEQDPLKWKSALVTEVDAETGEVKELAAPKYTTPELKAFWGPVIKELGERLEKRGLAGRMMLGINGDFCIVEDEATNLFSEIAPGMPWVSQGHSLDKALNGVPVGYATYVWGAGWGRGSIPDPDVRRVQGWNQSFLRATFPRWPGGSVTVPGASAPLSVFRTLTESLLVSGKRGFGRVSADFWPVLKDERGKTVRLVRRYPESSWGQLSVGNGWLSPGSDGARSNVRFEILLESIQECEARISVEKALLESRERLGAELAQRCQRLLDERTRFLRWCYVTNNSTWLWYPSSGWQGRSQQLYQTAAQVSRALEHRLAPTAAWK